MRYFFLTFFLLSVKLNIFANPASSFDLSEDNRKAYFAIDYGASQYKSTKPAIGSLKIGYAIAPNIYLELNGSKIFEDSILFENYTTTQKASFHYFHGNIVYELNKNNPLLLPYFSFGLGASRLQLFEKETAWSSSWNGSLGFNIQLSQNINLELSGIFFKPCHFEFSNSRKYKKLHHLAILGGIKIKF